MSDWGKGQRVKLLFQSLRVYVKLQLKKDLCKDKRKFTSEALLSGQPEISDEKLHFNITLTTSTASYLIT